MREGVGFLIVVVGVVIVTAFGAKSSFIQTAPQVQILSDQSYCELLRSGPACVLLIKSDSGMNVSITSVTVNGISMTSVIIGASFCKSPVPKEALPIILPAGEILRIGATASSTPPNRVFSISVVIDNLNTVTSEFTGNPNDLYCNFNG